MAEAILTLSEALERANRGEPIVPATPKHLKRWTRDSDCLEQSNFAVMLRALGDGGPRKPLGRWLG